MRQYDIVDTVAVGELLRDNPHVVEVLEQAAATIRDIFVSNCTPILGASVYSEDDQDRQLTVHIPIGLPVRNALQLLEDFDETWWLDQPTGVRQLVVFDVVFR